MHDKFLDVSDEMVSAGQAQHDDTRSMTIKTYDKLVKGVCTGEASCDSSDTSYAFDARDQGVHQRKAFDARDQGFHRQGKMPKSTTLINAARPDRVHEARDA